jgi:hypothetical protein
MAQHGTAWHSKAQHGTAWHSMGSAYDPLCSHSPHLNPKKPWQKKTHALLNHAETATFMFAYTPILR